MPAVAHLIELVVERLAPAAQARLAQRATSRFDLPGRAAAVAASGHADAGALRAALLRRYDGDLAGLLNACRAEDLGRLAGALGLPPAGAGARRLELWRALEGRGAPDGAAPMLIGERLVPCAPPRGLWPPSPAWPRPLPAPRAPAPPEEEPECLDSLLDAADRALGVRLGARGRAGKGAWGQRAAALLGVVERGDREPDWRGDVELKTVAVRRSASGAWRVVEDPAVSALGAAPLTKLQRVLWLCRADAERGDATLVSWYLLDWDPEVAALVQRYLHTRPKGPRGGAGRGYYLHKRFFADAGLLASLNGPSPP
ncbi:MAG: hypothetical protein R3B48_01160 [Kofleriaceae bacterium]